MKRTKKGRPMSDVEKATIQAFRSNGFLSINKILISKEGLLKAGFISNLIDKLEYFSGKEDLQEDGSFFLTHSDQTTQLSMSDHEIRRCKKYFKEVGVLETYMKHIPPKEYYRINMNRMFDMYLRNIPQKYGGMDIKNSEDYIRRPNNNETKSFPTESSGPAGPVEKLDDGFLSIVNFWNELPKATKHKIDTPPSKTLLRAAKYVSNLVDGRAILCTKDGTPYKSLLDFVQKHSISSALIEKQWDLRSIRSVIRCVHNQLPESGPHSLESVFWNSHAKGGAFSWFLFIADRKEADPVSIELVEQIYSQEGVPVAPKSKQMNDAKLMYQFLAERDLDEVKAVLAWHIARPDTDQYKHRVSDTQEFISKFPNIQAAMKKAKSNGNGSFRKGKFNTVETNPALKLTHPVRCQVYDAETGKIVETVKNY